MIRFLSLLRYLIDTGCPAPFDHIYIVRRCKVPVNCEDAHSIISQMNDDDNFNRLDILSS